MFAETMCNYFSCSARKALKGHMSSALSLAPLFSLMLPVTHLDFVLEMSLSSVDVTPITPYFFAFSSPPYMLLGFLLYIYIMTKRNNPLLFTIARYINLQFAI